MDILGQECEESMTRLEDLKWYICKRLWMIKSLRQIRDMTLNLNASVYMICSIKVMTTIDCGF